MFTMFDQDMSFDPHIKQVSMTAFFHLPNIVKIRKISPTHLLPLDLITVILYYQDVLVSLWKVSSWNKMLQQNCWKGTEGEIILLLS